MKNILYLLCCLAINSSVAATNITTPTVSGNWTIAGSPYYIYNNITVHADSTLIIDPGVNVIFKGPYVVFVSGKMVATGTAMLPITFDVADTTGWYTDIPNTPTYNGGWRGITYDYYTSSVPDITTLSYCIFKHMRYSSVAPCRSISISNCTFTENKGGCINLMGGKKGGKHELLNCNFYNNNACYDGLITQLNANASWLVQGNNMHDNTVGRAGAIVFCQNSRMLFSKNNIYSNSIPPLPLPGEDAHILKFVSDGKTNCILSFEGNRVYDNASMFSAALYCYGIIADINGNYICNNYQLEVGNCGHMLGGGGMFLLGNGDYGKATIADGLPSVYTVRNNIIANNYSAQYGGGIYVYNARSLFSNNTLVNNKALRGGAMDVFMISDTTTICIRNNIFYGNVNENGLKGNVNLSSNKKTRLKYDYNWTVNNFKNDIDIMYGKATIIGDTNTNVKGINPALISPTLTANYTESALSSDFGLLSGSPCINKGTDGAVASGSVDYAGNNRKSCAVDIGAYEYSALPATAGPTPDINAMFTECCAVIEPLAIYTMVNRNVDMNIYPNPAGSVVFISTPDAKGTLIITDALGRGVIQKNVTDILTSIDVHTLPRGNYTATWKNGNDNTTRKLVIE